MIFPLQDSLLKQPLHSSLCQEHNKNQTHRVRLTTLPIIEAFEKSAEKEKVHNWVKAFRNNSYHWILMDSYEKWRNLLQSDQPLLDLRIHWAYEQPHPLENKKRGWLAWSLYCSEQQGRHADEILLVKHRQLQWTLLSLCLIVNVVTFTARHRLS